jgi:hypothetical protein
MSSDISCSDHEGGNDEDRGGEGGEAGRQLLDETHVTFLRENGTRFGPGAELDPGTLILK